MIQQEMIRGAIMGRSDKQPVPAFSSEEKKIDKRNEGPS